MPESVVRLLAFLQQARRRHVRTVVLGGVSASAAALFVGWAFATWAANEGTRAGGLLAIFAAFSVAVAVAISRGRHLREWAGARGQARRVEALVPALRGGLLTVVDRAARPQGSDALLGRLAREIEPAMREWPAHRVWPREPVQRDLRWLFAALLVFATAATLLPVGPVDALQSLFARPAAATIRSAVLTTGPRAVLGDITLRYLYPTYTKLEPIEVPNTTGEVHAPPGTRVEISARTLEPWGAAALVAYGETLPAELVDGRLVSGGFTVAGEGIWRFESDILPSADFRIVPDPDLPPTVTTTLKPVDSVSADGVFGFPFEAKDDYGMTKVVVEVTLAGEVKEYTLRTPVDAPLALADVPTLRIAELGLTTGDAAQMRIGVWDNDEISGSKPGWTASFQVRVEGARGRREQQQQLQAELLVALIPVLADFLVDGDPVATTVAGIRAYGETADARYAKFDLLAETVLGGPPARIVEDVSAARRDLVAFARSLRSDTINPKDASRLAALHAENVETLETAVWTLDQLQRLAASREVLKLVKELAKEAGELRDDLPKLTDAQALARLDQLDRLWKQIALQAKKLDAGGIRDFLFSRGAELEGAMAAARRDIAKGDDPAAKRDMERVAQLLEEMAGGVEESRKRQTGSGDELRKEMDAVRAELEALAEDQAALRKKTQAAREKHGQKLDDGMKAWEKVSQAVAEVERNLRDPSVQNAAEASGAAKSAVADAKHDAEGLADSTRGRDVETARERADTLEYTLERAEKRVQAAQRSGDLDPASAAQALSKLSQAKAAARSAAESLDQLASQAGNSSPQLQKALEELAGDQESLAERAQKSAERARKLSQNMPVDASKLGESAQEGAQEAGRATSALENGDSMAAEGGQQSAEEAFRRALDAMDQAESDMQQLQQAGDPGENEGEGKGARGDQQEDGEEGRGKQHGEGGKGRDEIKIPAPEEFQTPEEYRQALLEGMQGEVPEAYRALNRRYYEELVRQ